jgi:uncharacterized membrane protein YgdD (TMEM256/DUF423 family)
MSKLFLILGSINAAAAVTMGAFGAHFLKTKISEAMLSVFRTAVQYHFYHSLGLLIVGLLSITDTRWLGMITPFGGFAFIISWVYVAISVWKWSSSHRL